MHGRGKSNSFLYIYRVKIPDSLYERMQEVWSGTGRITVLTGAGISADSGIPTYRGSDGIWIKGTEHYTPQEFATIHFMRQHPRKVWAFGLYRRSMLGGAKPNAGHEALVEMEAALGDRFALITQNVDGLHLAAGSSPERTFEIHGNYRSLRCSEACTHDLYPFPSEIEPRDEYRELTDEEWKLLACPRCGAFLRANVLLFDETYNERFYRADSAMDMVDQTDLLFVAGSTGATSLPRRIADAMLMAGKTVVDINIEFNHFSKVAEMSYKGQVLAGSSSNWIPALAEASRRLTS